MLIGWQAVLGGDLGGFGEGGGSLSSEEGHCHALAPANCLVTAQHITAGLSVCRGITIPILLEGKLRPSEVRVLDRGSLESRTGTSDPLLDYPWRRVGPRSEQAGRPLDCQQGHLQSLETKSWRELPLSHGLVGGTAHLSLAVHQGRTYPFISTHSQILSLSVGACTGWGLVAVWSHP